MTDLSPKHSEKLAAWFNDNSNVPGFWQFFMPGLSDYEIYHHEDTWDHFDRGIAFGKLAGKKPVLLYADDDVTFYFIGSERDVLRKLNTAYQAWVKKNPPGKETLKRLELEQELQRLKSEQAINDSRLKALNDQIRALK